MATKKAVSSGDAAKKSRAKRKTVSSGAPSPDEAAVTQAAAAFLGTLPSLPHLLLCHVAVLDGREAEISARLELTELQVKQYADVYLALGAGTGHCFACASDLTPGQECSCVEKLRKGYREFLPRWEEKLPAIVAGVRDGTIETFAPIYRDNCRSCGTAFVINAGMVARACEKWGAHERARYCREHAQQRRQRTDRREQRNEKAGAPTPAARREAGLATIGEQVVAKGSQGQTG